MNPYEILNLPLNSSIEDVKKTYKKIAIMSHPDKLNNITDINEKNKKIKFFMDATNAYNIIIKSNNDYGNGYGNSNGYGNGNSNGYGNDYDFNNEMNTEDWEKTFDSIMNSDLFKSFVINVFNKFKSKVKKHDINVDIKIADYFNNHKKKLRIFLKNVQEPVYINLNCKNYPSHTINYFDNNDNEHEINIQMNIINDPIINKGFYYKENEDGDENSDENGDEDRNEFGIDIYYDMNIDIIDYLIGTKKELEFFNNETIDIDIKPFSLNVMKNGMGINKGNLIVNFIYNSINKEKWYNLPDADKNEMIRILKKMKNI